MKKLPKIAHLTSAHRVKDTRILLKECCSLKRKGYDITLIAAHNTDEIVEGIAVIGVKKNKGRLSRYIKTANSVYKKAVENNFEVCHFHDPELIPFAMLLRLKGKKVIYDVHEDLPKQILSKEWIPAIFRYPVSWIIKLLEWFSSRYFFSAIAVATPKISEKFPKGKTHLIQNFPIKNELVKENITTYSERPLNIVYIGGIGKIRGIKEIIRSLELLTDKSMTLQLVGKFESNELLTFCQSQKGWNYVNYQEFLNRKQVAALFDQSRIGLVVFYPEPNHVDAQPNKLFEYMSAGIPVVASNFPLWRKIIEGSDCGVCVDPLNPKSIADAIDFLYNNPERAEEMGKNGKKAVENQYNWAIEEGKLFDLYNKIV